MKRQNLFAIACVATTAAATLVGNVGSASASALTGTFDFSSHTGSPSTIGKISSTGIYFTPNPGQIDIANDYATGTLGLGGFTAASLYSPSPLTFNSTNLGTLLLDLGTTGGSLTDGQNIFSYTSVLPLSMFENATKTKTFFGLTVEGLFTSATGEQTKGTGSFTLQVNQSLAAVESILKSGGTVNAMTFSGEFSATEAVPEPTALAGLGLVAGLLAVSRRRKADHN